MEQLQILEKKFNFYIPLKKDIQSGNSLTGIASTLSIDRDEEKMSLHALQQMVEDINSSGVNLFSDHEHSVWNTLGIIKHANLQDKQVLVKIDLDDPSTNERVPVLLNKLARGIKLGLSVGGTVTKEKFEYDSDLGKKIKVIDGVKLYEISVVGIPSNADCGLSIPGQISKSFEKSLNIDRKVICPCCYSDFNKGICEVCLYYG